MTHKTGGWLLTLGILAVVIGGFFWQSANHNAHKNDESAAMGQYIFGSSPQATKPDHTVSVVLFVGGGGLALFGMIVLAGHPTVDTKRDTTDPP